MAGKKWSITRVTPGRYTRGQVFALLGLRERGWSQGERNVTFLDLLSWANDPGGGHWLQKMDLEHPDDAWMARRGPLSPESPMAILLFDFLRAMKRLVHSDVRDGAIVALAVFGFTSGEIAGVLRTSQSAISHKLRGRHLYDRDGLYQGRSRSLVDDLTAAMNGEEGS